MRINWSRYVVTFAKVLNEKPNIFGEQWNIRKSFMAVQFGMFISRSTVGVVAKRVIPSENVYDDTQNTC